MISSANLNQNQLQIIYLSTITIYSIYIHDFYLLASFKITSKVKIIIC